MNFRFEKIAKRIDCETYGNISLKVSEMYISLIPFVSLHIINKLQRSSDIRPLMALSSRPHLLCLR